MPANLTKLRLALGLLSAFSVITMMQTSARAEINYPYCIRVNTEGGDFPDCRFPTLASCKIAASGLPAQCFADPFFAQRTGAKVGVVGSLYGVRSH